MQRAGRQRYEESLMAAHALRGKPAPSAVPARPVSQPQATPPFSRTRNASRGQGHALSNREENQRLYDYECSVKDRFDAIVPALREISALQHEADFTRQAQRVAHDKLGFELPEIILEDAWVEQLDMRSLFAWCVFTTYERYCNQFNEHDPLAAGDIAGFDAFLQACGFHTMDISPCADGRLAHVIRYVLRLPHRAVRRKSYAGAMFDVEDSIQKWIETEMLRYREGRPNTADAPTRYLKIAAYHFSSVDPAHQGCAAHGSDEAKAAAAALQRLEGFQQAIENSFCCGASIDLLLMGVDTDTDAIKVHVPDGQGTINLGRYVDVLDVFDRSTSQDAARAGETIREAISECSAEVDEGMLELCAFLIENNLSQIEYVRTFHGRHYSDIGHAERFIGAGIGFEEIQLRNLMYFAYMETVEEGAPDLDVGIKIFSGLNVSHGLPVPIVVRYDYHGEVPGSRERSVQHCERVENALKARYRELFERGMLHTLMVIRDCDQSKPLEVVGSSVATDATGSGH